jgi:DNA-binding MarR family transcriptional regulator
MFISSPVIERHGKYVHMQVNSRKNSPDATSDPREMGDPSSENFRVAAYPFYQLNKTVSRYNIVIETELRAIGLDIPSWRVLMVLGEASPRSVGEISKAAVINLSTMTRIVERMMKAGLVQRAPSGADGRVTDVIMTGEGRAKLAQARARTAPVYRRAIAGFSARDFSRLLQLMGRLHDNLS